jgi:hypothetical protein
MHTLMGLRGFTFNLLLVPGTFRKFREVLFLFCRGGGVVPGTVRGYKMENYAMFVFWVV